MSRRTKLLAFAIFVVLLGISLGYLVLAWHPAAPLTFHLEAAEPTVRNNNNLGAYRARWVRIENSSIAPIEFFGATALLKSGSLAFRDGPPGLILPGGPAWPVVPANGHLVANASLDPVLLREIPEGNVYVLYKWQSLPRSKAVSVTKWLREHGPAWAGKYIPRFQPWEDYIPMQAAPSPDVK